MSAKAWLRSSDLARVSCPDRSILWAYSLEKRQPRIAISIKKFAFSIAFHGSDFHRQGRGQIEKTRESASRTTSKILDECSHTGECTYTLKNDIKIILMLLIVFLPAVLFADTVTLRTGQVIDGKIVNQTRTEIQIATGGQVQTIQKVNVLRVTYGASLEEVQRQQEEARQAELKRQEEARRAEEEKRRQEEAKNSSNTNQQPAATDASARSRWSPVWRSAVLPGWGEAYSGHRTAGIVYGSLFLGSVGYALAAQRTALGAKESYNTSTVNSKLLLAAGVSQAGALVPFLDSGAKLSYEHSVGKYNSSLNIIAAIYLVQLVHTFFMGKEFAAAPVPSSWNLNFDYNVTSIVNAYPGEGMDRSFLFRASYAF